MSWNVTHCEVSASELTSGAGAFSMHTHYFNHSGKDVWVLLRNGLKIKLPNEVNYGNVGFKIRTDIYCDSSVLPSVYKQLLEVEHFPKQELAVIRRYLDTRLGTEASQQYRGGHLISLWYTVPAHQLKLVRTSEFYLADADIVISMKDDIGEGITHPYSEAGTMLRVSKELNNSSGSEASAGLNYLVVDNSGVVDKLYLRVGTKIYPIKSQRHFDKGEGVYIRDSVTGETHWLSFDENLAEWGLFRTHSEASELGDKLLEDILKREYTERELSLQQQLLASRSDFEHLKMETKKREMELAQRYDAYKREVELNDLLRKNKEAERKAARDDYYEERSAVRKDSTEALKSIPVLLAGIGGVFTIFKTLGLF